MRPGEVDTRAEALKRQFYEQENLTRAFAFLVKMTGKGAITRSLFALLLNKAEKVGQWHLAHLPVWAVPYLLLLLIDFVVRPYQGRTDRIRFVIHKPRKSQLQSTWLGAEQCRLERLVVNCDIPRRSSVRARPGEPKLPNPLPFSEQIFLSISSDNAWLNVSLLELSKEMTMEAASVEATSTEAAQPIEAASARHASTAKPGNRLGPGAAPDANIVQGEYVATAPLHHAPQAAPTSNPQHLQRPKHTPAHQAPPKSRSSDNLQDGQAGAAVPIMPPQQMPSQVSTPNVAERVREPVRDARLGGKPGKSQPKSIRTHLTGMVKGLFGW